MPAEPAITKGQQDGVVAAAAHGGSDLRTGDFQVFYLIEIVEATLE